MTDPRVPASSSTPMSELNEVHLPAMLKRISELACVPSPFGYVVPLSVIVFPSPAAASPFDLSLSTGPKPFVAEVQARSLRYLVVGPPPAAVVNDHVLALASVFPDVSWTPLAPPTTVAV